MSSTENPEVGAGQVDGPGATSEAVTPETAPEVATPGAPEGATPSPADDPVADPTEDASAPTEAAAEPELAEPQVAEPQAAEPQAAEPQAAEATVADPTQDAPTQPEGELPAAVAEVLAAEAEANQTSEVVSPAEAPETETPEPVAETAPEPAPAPAPVPHPGPVVVPPPSAVAHSPAAEAPVVPHSDPSEWGRVDDEGTVYVRTAEGERAVGSWQAGDPAAGLAHYGRRYDDLATEVTLLEARLKAHTGNPTEIKAKAQALAESIPVATAVGDLDGLAARARAMVETADAAAAEFRAERAAARAAQIARKEALAAEAEQIAAESTSWKTAGDRLKAIVEEWKTIRGIDRKTDEALWTRFAAARDAFGRRRGTHFAALDAQRSEARAQKQELIAEAQRLSASTDWGATSAAMRSLMERWKAVPRTGRDGDDDLWKQFRAAQDAFFTARTNSDKERNAEQLANQQKKDELLAEAEKLDASGDPRAAQNALRRIQERYDAIGHVPRAAMRGLEDRMQAVEQRIRGAVDSNRPRSAPENPMVRSMREAVAKAEEQLAKAEASGDGKRVEEAQANLATRREWLAEAEKPGR